MNDSSWLQRLGRRLRRAFSAPPRHPSPSPDLPLSKNGHIATHEAGHVMAAWASPYVVNVTGAMMVPYRSGVTLYQTRAPPAGPPLRLWDELVISLGGVAGETAAFGSFRSGNSRHDLMDALDFARRIIAAGGRLADAPFAPKDGPRLPFTKMFRDAIPDAEAAILAHGYARARHLIALRHDDFRLVAHALLAEQRLSAYRLHDLLGARPWVLRI